MPKNRFEILEMRESVIEAAKKKLDRQGYSAWYKHATDNHITVEVNRSGDFIVDFRWNSSNIPLLEEGQPHRRVHVSISEIDE